jgi:hypothetical protein
VHLHPQGERRQIDERNASIAASLVRAVLDDQPDARRGFTERTGYRLEQRHLAAVLWVASANPGIDRTVGLRDLAGELDDGCAAGRPLFTAVNRSSAWVWFGLGNGGTEPDLEAVRTIMAGSPDTQIALGRTGPGRRGSRESHR